jgi:hypothetical protein
MTPADEATFIALWQQGLSQDAIAQQLGCPVGTVKSRAHTLAHQGKIQARPRGGAYPHQKALARQESAGVSPDTPRVSRRVSADTPAPQYLPPGQDDMRPLLTDILQELRQLTGALAARVSPDTHGVSPDTRGVSGDRWGVTSHPSAAGSGGIGALESAPLRPAARAHQSHGRRAGATG